VQASRPFGTRASFASAFCHRDPRSSISEETTVQDYMRPSVLNRRTVVVGAGVLAVTAALPGCATAGRSVAGPGTTLGSTAQVPVGAGIVFADQQVVVTQPSAGAFEAFSAICTHQGCTVNDVTGGTINCPCHGSMFDITDGSVVRGPAQQPLPRLGVTIERTLLKLA
jgi:nitrite reductase/ring-hydroxylating ferredoxin subunit